MRVVYNKRFCTHAHAHGYLGHRGLNSLRFAIGKGYERFAVKQIQLIYSEKINKLSSQILIILIRIVILLRN